MDRYVSDSGQVDVRLAQCRGADPCNTLMLLPVWSWHSSGFESLVHFHGGDAVNSVQRLSILSMVVVSLATACAAPNRAAVDVREPEVARAGALAADRGAAIDLYLREQVRKGFSGVVLIADRDHVLIHEAYSTDKRISRDSAFWIGSVSKPFAAQAVVRLQEQGKLATGDPIFRHIDNVPSDKRHITIHHLLTHTSGLGDHYAADGIQDRETALQAILSKPLAGPSGTYRYSSDGYALLGILLSVVAGETYEDYVRSNVFEPAGMSASDFWGATASECTLAPVAKPPLSPETAAPNWGYRAATGICSTAMDLHRWQQRLHSRQLLSGMSTELLFAPHAQRTESDAYGYGWQVIDTDRGTRLLTHSGAESGIEHYASVRRYVDDGWTVVLLSNAPEELTWQTLSEVDRILLD